MDLTYVKIVLTCLLVCAAVAEDLNQNFIFEPVNNSIGLYYEKVSPVALYNNEWNIVYHINITSIQEEYEHIEEIVEKVDDICKHLGQHFPNIRNFTYSCGATLEEVKYIMSDIEHFNINWFRSAKRSKRGALNVVGNVLNALFGTLSQEDAESYLSTIAELEHTEKETQLIVDKQTTIITSTAELLKQYKRDNVVLYEKLEKQFELVNVTLGKLREIGTLWHNLQTVVEVQNLLLFVSLLLTSFRYKQQQFLEALSLLSNKHSQNPIVLPPELFINELLKIENQIKIKNLKLPLDVNRNSISLFYQIATTRSRIVEDQVLICMSMPLLDIEKYEPIKVSSFPKKISNTIYSFIIPEYEYLVIDSFREKFISFSNKELESCFDLNYRSESNLLICMQSSPIVEITSKGNDCGVTLMSQNKVVEKCDVRVSNISSQMFIKLREVNAWIYVFPKKEVIYMRCNNVPIIEKLLEGSGILRMKQGCGIKSNVMLIESHSVFNSDIYQEIRSIVSPEFDYKITDYIEEFNSELEIKHIPSPHIISSGESDKLKELSNGINELKNFKRTKLLKQKKVYEYMKILSCIFAIVVILVVAYYTLKHKCCSKRDIDVDV